MPGTEVPQLELSRVNFMTRFLVFFAFAALSVGCDAHGGYEVLNEFRQNPQRGEGIPARL